MQLKSESPITPRRDLDFCAGTGVPRFWFAGDPFKTRLFDAHSLMTPAGERFFIDSVRAYREEITDPVLIQQVKGFIAQEGQHSLQHAGANERLGSQGIDVARIEAEQQQIAELQRRRLSPQWAMAMTAGYEHLTAVVATAVTEHGVLFNGADDRIFALYAWHCAEEQEHKAVCFDVMQRVAKVGYLRRTTALALGTILFQLEVSRMVDRLLRADGFSFRQRLALWSGGLRWMYGRGGFFRVQLRHYASYFRRGFHPSLFGEMAGYHRWEEAFRSEQDPFAASAAIRPVIADG